MADAINMNVVTKSFRSALDETAGQFRRAANENNVNFNKIVKDIGSMFKSQRADITELTNSVQESVSESQQAAAKIDAQSALIREGLSLQSDMRDYLKTISVNIKTLNDNTVQLSNNITGSGVGSLSTTLSSTFTNALKGLGLLTTGAVVGGAAVNALSGGGGGYKMGAGETASGQQIVSGLMNRGFSKAESAAIAGNLNAESSFNTGNVNQKSGAFGLMQWLGPRKQQLLEFARSQNKDASDLNLQLDFIKKELKGGGQETNAFNRAVSESGGDVSKLSYLFGKYVERPSDTELAQSASRRTAVATQLYGSAGQTSTTTDSKTSDATQVDAPPPSATSPRYEGPGSGHGPVSGHGSHSDGIQPGILDKFKQIQSQAGTPLTITSGYRSPAHNAEVGGAKNSAHTRGNAVDVTFAGGIPETLKLIDAASKAGIGGIGVYRPGVLHFDTEGKRAWGPSYHSDSIPNWARESIQRHLGGGTGKADAESAGTTPSGSSAPGTSPSSEATPVSQSTVSPSVSAGMTGTDMSSMMPMMGGGMGGMIGTLMPLVGSLLGGLGAPSGLGGQQNPIAEMLQSLSESTSSIDMMNQTAIQNQAQQQFSQEMLSMTSQETRKGVETNIATNTMSGGGMGYAYNTPDDTGWPDWASMIGGNHWSEMKKYKQNMWG